MLIVTEREVWTQTDRDNLATWCGLKLISGPNGGYWCEPKAPHEVIFCVGLDKPENSQGVALRLAHYVVWAGEYTKLSMDLDHYRGFYCQVTAADELQLRDSAPVRRDILAMGSSLESVICECLYWACAPADIFEAMQAEKLGHEATSQT